MSLEYCQECNKMIDLDNDEHLEHFGEEWENQDINRMLKELIK